MTKSIRTAAPDLLALGVAFAICALAPQPVAEEARRGFFGLMPILEGDRVLVRSVTPGGPADDAGIEPGDVVVMLADDRIPIQSQSAVFEAFTSFREGETVRLVVRRDGSLRKLELTLDAVPKATREQQALIEETERRVRASEAVDEILGTYDRIELSMSPEGDLRLREDGGSPWEVLDPYVARSFRSLWEGAREDDPRRIVRFRLERDGDALQLVPVDVEEPE